MRTRYGISPWIDLFPRTRRPEHPRLRGEHTANVVIVGGGLTGCATAYACAAAGLRPLLIEADRLGSGSAEYPAASITPNRTDLARWVKIILTYLSGRRPHLDLPLDIQATAFQWTVWRYLQSIPYGETRAYSQVARDIGKPSAVRAVARACATNPVCLVIPCHRVVGKDGSLTGYRWGVERKRTLLEKEK